MPLALLIGVLGLLQQAAPAFATAPPNDAFAAAQPLSGTSASVAGTTVGATTEVGEPSHFVSGNGSVWYSWTAPLRSNVRLDACAEDHPTKIQVYTGSSLASLTEVAGSTGRCAGASGDSNRFQVTAGTTYRIAVIEYASDATFTLALAAPPSPANDDFANAQAIGSLPVDIASTTTDTTVEPGEAGYLDDPNYGESVWYKWTAPADMRVWIDNCDAASDTGVTVYRGSSLGSLAGVADLQAPVCAGGGVFGRRFEFRAKKGAEYRIRVYSALYADGAFHLRMERTIFDGSLSQDASAKRIHRGGTITYRVKVRNLGTEPFDPWVYLFVTKPHKIAQGVRGVRYLSVKSSHGPCKHFVEGTESPGAAHIFGEICKIGVVAPGASVSITAKLRATRSFSHGALLDYDDGLSTDNPTIDDVPRNDRMLISTPIVKR